MKGFLYLFLFVLVHGSSLVRINDKNFREVVQESGKFTLVDFYADWCRHCMNLMPAIEEVADTFAEIPEIQIVKINGDEDGKKMAKKYEVPGFPMLLMFDGDNKPIEYEGMRNAQAISNFIQQVSGIRLGEEPSVPVVEKPNHVVALNDQNFEELVLKANHKTMVSFTAPWCRYCKDLKPLWLKMANEIYDIDSAVIQFGEVDLREENRANVEKIKTQFGVSRLPTILLFDPSKVDKDGLRSPTTYTDDRNLEYLVTFVNDETGLNRDTTGKLHRSAGRIMAFDAAFKTLTKDNGADVLLQLNDLEKLVEAEGRNKLVEQDVLFFNDDVAMIPYYRKIISKLLSGEEVFFANELARLKRIISNDERNLRRETLDYMQKRANVLQEVVKTRKL